MSCVKNENSKLISKKIDKAIYEYKLIEPGDKVLLAISGGKDSLTMAYFLGRKAKGFPIPFEVQGLYIRSDFDGCAASPQMFKLLEEWDVKLDVLDVGIVERLKEGQTLNCYWCSTQRRIELMNYASQNGFNKIALGHHLDDIIETTLMNMALKSQISTMLPKMQYKKFNQTIIRPLARVSVNEISKFANDSGFLAQASSCPYGKNSKRLNVRAAISMLAKTEGEHIRTNLYESLSNIDFEYLPSSICEDKTNLK